MFLSKLFLFLGYLFCIIDNFDKLIVLINGNENGIE